MKVGPRLQEYCGIDDATVLYEGPKAPYRYFLPGNNVETRFLIHDVYRALGEPDRPRLATRVRSWRRPRSGWASVPMGSCTCGTSSFSSMGCPTPTPGSWDPRNGSRRSTGGAKWS
eukprot:jgi/Botrbrau1/14605/Bobra.67_2s0005.1